MRIVHPALVGLICSMAIAGNAQQESLAHEAPTSEALLQQSYDMGSNFPPEERCFQLLRLAGAAGKIHSALADSLVRSWSNELFRRTLKLQKDWNRSAFQKNSLETLAAVDPVEALNLLRKIDIPGDTGIENPPEDLRAFAARRIFSRLWEMKGRSALEDIRFQARYIGRTGEYPYAAMIPIIQSLAQHEDTEKLQDIFREALEFYVRGPHVLSANKEFIEFVDAGWSYVPLLQRQVMTAIISRLIRKPKVDSTTAYISRVTTDTGVLSFKDENAVLLFLVLPKIRQIDPEWADRLQEESPELKQAAAAGTVKSTASVRVVGVQDGSQGSVTATLNRGMQSAVLSQLRQGATDNPNQAVLLMGSLTDPEFHAEGLASLASAFGTRDPVRATDLLVAAENALQKITDNTAKVRALVSLAEAAAALRDHERMSTAMQKAFDLGEEVLNEDLDIHPGKALYLGATVDDLFQLTRLGVQIDFRGTATRLDHLKNETLHAYLLIAGAEGLQTLKDLPPANVALH